MAKSALIEELEKQFSENPRRVFARLANEYRKSGDLELAIDICRTHIPQQPSYISGYIVLGQALFESRQYDDAKSTFETALGLDPENLIALRQLGDIARVQGDADTARAWYQRLLEVDPQNEEAAAQLEALTPAASSTPTPESEPRSGGDEFGWREINPVDTAALEPPASAALPDWMNPEPPGLSRPSDAVAEHEPIDLDTDTSVAASAAITEEIPRVELPSAPEQGAEEDAFPDLELSEPRVEPEPSPREETREPERPPIFEPRLQDTAMWPTPPSVPAMRRDERASEIPTTFVTETMAELYLQQGFDSEALDIYRQLLAQRPGDEGLRSKIEAIEAQSRVPEPERERREPAPASSGETVRQFFTRIARMRAPDAATAGAEAMATPAATAEVEPAAPPENIEIEEPPPAPSPPAAPSPTAAQSSSDETGAREALFTDAPVSASDEQAARALSSAFDDFLAETGTPSGQPAREASSELSLDDVFRDVTRPAAEGRPNGAVSFDDFFGGAEGEQSRETTRETSEQKSSDLETFHAWLEGLKK